MIQLQGAVQKGPFLIGSSVTLSLLDNHLSPTGQVFNTQTINNLGEFEINFSAAGPVLLQGEGFYFNEVRGVLSTAPIALRAFYVPTGIGVQHAYINMVAHLTAGRVETLVQSGAEFTAAVAQAEAELVRELSITAPGYAPSVPGTTMNINGVDNADNAYLLGVSATMIQLAVEQGGATVDATLQEALNSFSSDLSDGTLEDTRKAAIWSALAHFDVGQVRQNLSIRLEVLGSAAPIPDMNQVLDQDRDGVANALDVCPNPAADAFLCSNAHCVRPDLRCDGIDQCADGSDEENCSSCTGGAFLCSNARCVEPDLHCDGVDQCGDGSDENGFLVLQAKCGGGGCHGAGANLNTFAASEAEALDFVGRDSVFPSCTGPVLDPEDPAASLVVQKLGESPPCGSRMPLGGTPLSDLEVTCIESWIGGL